MARRRSTRKGPGYRRPVTWAFVGGDASKQTLTADGGFFQAVTFAIAQPDELTVVRTRGNLSVLAAGTAGDSCDWACGIGMIPAVTGAAGGAAIPLPYTDAGWDGWLWHQFGSVLVPTASLAQEITTNAAIQIDSKAMRKWETSERAMFLAFEMANEAGTGITMNVLFNYRCLFKT